MNGTLKLRRPTESDVTEIEHLAENYDFPLVDEFKTAAVVEKDKSVIAFGVTRSILEVVLYCEGRDREKALAMSKLLDQAKSDARTMGYDSIYAFIWDDGVAKSLIKHHGFRIAKGTPVILDLEPV